MHELSRSFKKNSLVNGNNAAIYLRPLVVCPYARALAYCLLIAYPSRLLAGLLVSFFEASSVSMYVVLCVHRLRADRPYDIISSPYAVRAYAYVRDEEKATVWSMHVVEASIYMSCY
jgi:hypothetical protein